MRLLLLAFLVLVPLYWAYFNFFSHEQPLLTVVFCDVGQGDATLFLYKKIQFVIDGGPGRKVLDCLDAYLPKNDKTIEVVLLTHPDLDHVGGITDILDYYSVERLIMNDYLRNTPIMQVLREKIDNEVPRLKVYSSLFAGDNLNLNSLHLSLLWPEEGWMIDNFSLEKSSGIVDPDLFNYNMLSFVSLVSYGNFDVLINADADSLVQDDMLSYNLFPENVEVMTAPHHGSGTGILDEWLRLVNPRLVVISAGINNRYGHPHPATIEKLNARNIKYLRTDYVGDIVIQSDGEKWWIN